MPEEFLSHFIVRVGGANAPEEFLAGLVSLSVDQTLTAPAMATIHTHDPNLEWTNSDQFKPGTPLEVEVEYQGQRALLFKGEITSLGPDFAALGPTLRLYAYDKSHRLHRGRKIRTFLNRKDSDVARELAGEAGLQPDVDPTAGVHDYIIQHNQTNWEFLSFLARRSGARLYADGDKLAFKQPGGGAGETVPVEWGVGLLQFRARLATVEQVSQVTARGYDPKTKEPIVGRSRDGRLRPRIGISQSGGSYAGSAYGEARTAIVRQPLASQAEAEALAQSEQDDIESSFIEAEGLCLGNPKIKAGCRLQIKGVGDRFRGLYEVTSASHTFTLREGFRSAFVTSGKRSSGLLDLLGSRPTPQPLQLVVGIVTNNQDPEDMARVKVKFPWLADNEESWWLRVTSPMAGPERGLYILPEVNDEVLVGFDHGDPHHGYVLGAVWNGQDRPPLSRSEAVAGDGKVKQRLFKSRTGHTLLIDDSPDEPGITLKTKAGHTLHLDDSAGGKIVLVDKTGNHRLTIDSAANRVTLNVKGDLELDAVGQVKIHGALVEINADADLAIKGAMVRIN